MLSPSPVRRSARIIASFFVVMIVFMRVVTKQFSFIHVHVFLGKPEGGRPLGRPRRRWVGNIKMDLQGVECRCMDWIGLTQDRDRWGTLVSAVMNLRVP